MAHINVDLNNVSDEDVHPEGMTHLRVVAGETKKKKGEENGAGYIEWKLEVVNSPTGLKRPIYMVTSLRPDALSGLKRFLKACRHQWASDGSFDVEDVYGSEFMGHVAIEEYEGEKRNKVKFPYQPVA